MSSPVSISRSARSQMLVFPLITFFLSIVACFSAVLPKKESNVHKASSTELNLGPEGIASGTFRSTYEGNEPISNIPSHLSESVFRTARFGRDFSYHFEVIPGTYLVQLGFVETYNPHCDIEGKRVFHVFVNGEIHLESHDIFASAPGCFRAQLVTIPSSFSIGYASNNGITVRFQSVSNFAQVAYIKLIKMDGRNACKSDSTTGELSADHSAHSVPGEYPTPFVDYNNDGFADVVLDGTGSHTHFFDAKHDIIGKLTKYEWTDVEIGEVISHSSRFTHRFPLGTTRVRLTVTDNSCSSHEAETSVTVTGTLHNGMYCYFYKNVDLKNDVIPPMSINEPKTPNTAKVIKFLGLNKFQLGDNENLVRCRFFIQHLDSPKDVKVVIDTFSSGTAKLFRGRDVVLDSKSASHADILFLTGLNQFELIYKRHSNEEPKQRFQLFIDNEIPSNENLKYDRSSVVPVLKSLSEAIGKTSGGTRIKFSGFGLYQPLRVQFGTEKFEISKENNSDKEFSIDSPAYHREGVVFVFVLTATGMKSNSLQFKYSNEACDAVNFRHTTLKDKEGRGLKVLSLPTCITIGPDNNLYVGTLGAVVHVIGYDGNSLNAKSHCKSNPIVEGNYRDKWGAYSTFNILGIAFNPYDNGEMIRPYVSASILYRQAGRIEENNTAWWRNGGVHRLKKISDPSKFPLTENKNDVGICLGYDRKIVSNLPVSARDHAVNALEFTQDGDLLISVGGFTNMGLPSSKLGNTWETFFSAAVLLAKTSRPGFNGDIRYSHGGKLHLARPTKGHVYLYATGIRNMFGMTMTQDEKLYGVDQGPNCGFGNWATKCSEFDYKKTPFLSSNQDFPTDVRGPDSDRCGENSGTNRKDKILLLNKGKYYGHPNLQRAKWGRDLKHGVQRDAECEWIDPKTLKSATGTSPLSPEVFVQPEALIKSSVTGITEYRAQHFCGALQGSMILTSFQTLQTYVMNRRTKTVENLSTKSGGIAVIEDRHGNLIFPLLHDKEINFNVMKPLVSKREQMTVVGAWPRRHRRSGGSKIYIGGSGFKANVRVLIGGVECPVIMGSVIDTELECIVPKVGTKQGLLLNLKVIQNGKQSVLFGAVLLTKNE